MQFVFSLLRIGFGLLFIAASVDKIMHPALFAQMVANYQILPEVLVNPVALLVPWLELVCGAALVCNAFSRGAALVLNILLAVFLAALWFNVSRGLSVACGCFTVSTEVTGSMRESAIRDSLLLPWGLIVLWRAFAEAAACRKKCAGQGLQSPEDDTAPADEPVAQQDTPSTVSRPALGGDDKAEGLDWPKDTPKPESGEAK